jgi:hypothetical protein
MESSGDLKGSRAPILPEAFKLSDAQLPELAWINDEFMGVWIPREYRPAEAVTLRPAIGKG